jgi:acyl-CoA synthetase (AMP-forming)/AMP-acid ligase II
LAFLETERATHYLGWAHGARALADDPTFASRDLTAMRGGVLYEAMPVAARPMDRTLLGEALGMTETAGPHLFGHLQPVAEQFRGTFGQLAPGFEHRVVDVVTRSVVVDSTVGELQLRGDTLMIAMQKKEFRDCVDADGWFSTGDLVHMRDGHVFFHGRTDDAIKSRGSNVSPREVEAALLSIPGVATAFVTGVVDDQGDTVVGAVVTPEHEVDLAEDEIRNQARKTLSSYKVPRIVLLIAGSELPMAASSKVDRRALVARLQAAALSRDWRT